MPGCLGSAMAHGTPRLMLPVPSHVGLGESKPGGTRGGWGLRSAPAPSSGWGVVSGWHFHLEKRRVFLQGLNHRPPDPPVERSSFAP